MTHSHPDNRLSGKITRRALLVDALVATGIGAAGALVHDKIQRIRKRTKVFIAKAPSYSVDLASIVEAGLRQLGLGPEQVRGKRILLKPNFVETLRGAIHICTQPELIFGAAEAFRKLGAASVLIGEGPGHCRDTTRVIDEVRLSESLVEQKVQFVDLNNDDLVVRPNAGGRNGLATLTLPATVEQVDWIVSMPKMKTHHWVGVTLSMKNLFGLMPGIVYGWPKNVFHWAGIEQSILDINQTVQPHLAIIDGIVGMDGDGPIMGTPKPTGVIVMGTNLPATDATAARIMGIDPTKVSYLRSAHGRLGTIALDEIAQRGETIASVRTEYQLIDFIPAHQGLRPARK
ncbi:MAG TPA: DUF362 domain-containing protein [Sedimentisphaerales bacterium]|jgi:uncharacterized protein (DUF362 family)|nr:DUF362 domain-containing protein [Sedimentisphaerales bacterium]HNU31366.1 DUF362 domain-containing protein [Sedimentisphaerales bacterium]